MNTLKREPSNRSGEQYLLPIGIATSGQELKNLEKQMLMQYYQEHTHTNKYPYPQKNAYNHQQKNAQIQLPRSNSSASNYSHISNPQHTQKNSYFTNRPQYQDALKRQIYLHEYDQKIKADKETLKKQLARDLDLQIKHKLQVQNAQQQTILQKERQALARQTVLDTLERQKIQTYNQKVQEQARESSKINSLNRKSQVQQQKKEKEYFNQKYDDMNHMYKSHSERKITQLEDPTKNFYYEIQHAKQRGLQASINQRNSSFKITQNVEKSQRLSNLYKQSLNQHFSAEQQFHQMAKQHHLQQKNNLREVLLEQMEQSSARKNVLKLQQHYTPYTTKDYVNRHHPINNPVDIRYGNDNAYVLRQLKKVKESPNQNL